MHNPQTTKKNSFVENWQTNFKPKKTTSHNDLFKFFLFLNLSLFFIYDD